MNNTGSEIVAEYGKMYEKIRESNMDLEITELEFTQFDPSLLSLSKMFSNPNIKTLTDSYLEYILNKTSDEGNNIKIRIRIDFAVVGGLELNNKQLLDYVEHGCWESKETKDIWLSPDEFGRITSATEKQGTYINKVIQSGKINMIFVNRARVKFSDFVVDFKLKRKLGNCRQGNISNLYKSVNNAMYPPNPSLEIEHTGQFKKPWKDVKLEFTKVISWIIGHPIEEILTTTTPLFKIIPTSVITPAYLMNSIDPTQHKLTPKINGVGVMFKIDKKHVLVQQVLGPKVISIWRYKHLLTVTEDIYGSGEFIFDSDHSKCIYPYMILGHDVSTYKWEVQDCANLPYDHVLIKSKQWTGPFNDITDMLTAIYEMTVSKHSYETDGLILSSSYRHGKCDYKIKATSDIDIVGKVRFTYAGKSDPRQMATDGMILTVDYMSKNATNELVKINDNRIKLSPEFDYLNDIFCVKTTRVDPQLVKLSHAVVPIGFICEYDVRTKEIMIRLTKSSTHLWTKYLGNNWTTIQTIQHSVPILADLKLLSKWIKSPEARDHTVLQDVKINGTKSMNEMDDGLDPDRLNPKTTYFKENRIRSPLGYISNFVKSLLISLYASKMFYSNSKKARVCSIDFGNGADLTKYFYAGIQELIATDPDSAAIDTAHDRYMKLNKNEKSNYYRFNYLKTSIRNENFVSVIRTVTDQLNFDVIDWQFAAHFSWNHKHIQNIMHSLCEITKPGGRVLITTMNGKGLESILDKDDSVTFKIHPIEPTGYTTITKTSPTTFSVLTPLTTTTAMTEYIIDPDQMIKTFYDYGFVLLDQGRFDEVFNINVPFFKAGSLLETRPSTASFFAQQRGVVHDIKNTQLDQLLKYYIYMVFQRGT
ncbi:m-RNA capping enzyme large subunit [Salmon gill poxvirus]